jgi:hypothetical protein
MQKGGWYDWSNRKCQRRWGRCKSGPISRFCAVDSSEGSGTVVWWRKGRCIAVDSKRHYSNRGYVRTRPRRAGLALTKLLLKEARHGCCASFTHFRGVWSLESGDWRLETGDWRLEGATINYQLVGLNHHPVPLPAFRYWAKMTTGLKVTQQHRENISCQ